MTSKTRVEFTRFAEKRLDRLPKEIRENLSIWVELVEAIGLHGCRQIRGYRDEALKGKRFGQRSARLSRSYRVIYEQTEVGDCTIVGILEVNKHDY